MSPDLVSRTNDLLPRMKYAAASIYSSQPVPGLVQFDDIMQTMALRIIERAKQIPDLLEQTDAYIMIDATRNAGYRICNSEAIYLQHVTTEDIYPVTSDEEESQTTIFEVIPSEVMNPEEAAIEHQLAEALGEAIKNLTPGCREVVALSAAGLTDTQIAMRLGVSKSAISQRRALIRKNLKQFLS